jgi:hypothetical protein
MPDQRRDATHVRARHLGGPSPFRHAALVAGLLIAGCTSSSPAGGDLPCDVATVMKTRCAQCHGAEPTEGAHDSLVTYDDVYKKRSEVIARIKSGDMPPDPAPKVPASAIETLERWNAAGAPRGAACP